MWWLEQAQRRPQGDREPQCVSFLRLKHNVLYFHFMGEMMQRGREIVLYFLKLRYQYKKSINCCMKNKRK